MASVSELAIYHLVDKMSNKQKIKKIYRAHTELQEHFKRKDWEDRSIIVAFADKKARQDYEKQQIEESKFEEKLRKKYSLANDIEISHPDYYFRKDRDKLYAVRKYEKDSFILSKFYPSLGWFFLFKDSQRFFDPKYFDEAGNLWYISSVEESLELLKKRLCMIEDIKVKVEIKKIVTQREYSLKNLNVLLKLLEDKFEDRRSLMENIKMEPDYNGVLDQACQEYSRKDVFLSEELSMLKSWLNKWEPEDEIVLDYCETAMGLEELEKDHRTLDIEEWLQKSTKRIKD